MPGSDVIKNKNQMEYTETEMFVLLHALNSRDIEHC